MPHSFNFSKQTQQWPRWPLFHIPTLAETRWQPARFHHRWPARQWRRSGNDVSVRHCIKQGPCEAEMAKLGWKDIFNRFTYEFNSFKILWIWFDMNKELNHVQFFKLIKNTKLQILRNIFLLIKLILLIRIFKCINYHFVLIKKLFQYIILLNTFSSISHFTIFLIS